MNIYAISDLHLSINNPKPMNIFGAVWDNYLDDIADSLKDVTDDDVVLHAGDLSWAMRLDAAMPDLEYFSKICKGKKVIIRGNHDYWWEGITALRAVLPVDMYAVQNDFVKIDDLIICGSRGWSVDDKTEQGKKLYARELLRIEMSLKAMQKVRTDNDKVIFMIHYPPFNARFDDTPITELFAQYNINAVVYGHLHGRACRSKKLVHKHGIPYYLSSCDQVDNRAVKIEI